MTYFTASCSLNNGNIECGSVEDELACLKCLPHFWKTEITPKRAMNIFLKCDLYRNNCRTIGLADQEKLIKINLTTRTQLIKPVRMMIVTCDRQQMIYVFVTNKLNRVSVSRFPIQRTWFFTIEKRCTVWIINCRSVKNETSRILPRVNDRNKHLGVWNKIIG